MKYSITFHIETEQLESFDDAYLAQLWHIAQANPAPIESRRDAGWLAEIIGREIIRRWLRGITPEVWHHRGEHHFWCELIRIRDSEKKVTAPSTPPTPPVEAVAKPKDSL